MYNSDKLHMGKVQISSDYGRHGTTLGTFLVTVLVTFLEVLQVQKF